MDKLTKADLVKVFDRLAQALYKSNAASRNEGSRYSNDRLVIRLYDDGSGDVGEVGFFSDDMITRFDFGDIEELAEHLLAWIG